MVILIAPDSFKGSLSAQEAADAIGEGVRDALPAAALTLRPLSDGGEGLLNVLLPALGGELCTAIVAGPNPGQQVEARWGYAVDARTAIIEMAEAAGLGRVPPYQQNPLLATTYGVGQLITYALDRGARTLLIGIGGSATNDGGAGMARALGARFKDVGGNPLPPGGAALLHLASVDISGLDPRLRDTAVLVACDVRNPLTGPDGASAIFGPQKGAGPEEVTLLDAALEQFRRLLMELLHVDVQAIPGSGAAGGLGAGLVAFCGATLHSGIDLVLERTGFDALLLKADLVLTGEGQLDSQTRCGKVLSGVLSRALRAGVPVAAIVGDIKGNRNEFIGPQAFRDVAVLIDHTVTREESMRDARVLVRRKTAQLMHQLLPTLTT